ncbi:DUF3131 domain-containing protein [Photobacterium profundum]|uniref:DUF3131 domain-containing protein n=2 Tax=Photobacterium profundum TaxID=74109 RepID=Q1Z581_9GAMM|nr:hypothetical protein P3TCK_17937 [Photobacterium profundum 3TCK]PSV64138.1 DUF3131 domain-containing protein [Photobacterium profundum]
MLSHKTQLTICRIYVTSLLFVMSFFAYSNEESKEPEQPSFYGGRSVSQQSNQQLPEKITFQRRAIAPAIPIDDNTQLNIRSNLLQDKVNASTVKTKIVLSLDNISRQEWLLAKKASYYFERNENKKTGLTDSVQGYHHTTMWDIASDIGATLALEALELITTVQADAKLNRILTTLSTIPLYNDQLPNREYSTETGLPSGKNNNRNGNGWSALDIGRLLIWLEITIQQKPHFHKQVNIITERWLLTRAVHKKTLYGTRYQKNDELYRQEGRLGYLQYAAQGYQLAGLDVASSFNRDHTKIININDIPLYIDTRNVPFFTTDPYVLQAIELGENAAWWNQLEPIYQLHKQQYNQSKKLWMFSEDAISKSPWFSYNNIYFYGKSWLSTSPGGKPIENPQVFSNKIAFGLSVIFEDAFSDVLRQAVIQNSRSSRVIPTGIYKNNAPNASYNINTNSLILVSLWYKSRGNKAILTPTTTN